MPKKQEANATISKKVVRGRFLGPPKFRGSVVLEIRWIFRFCVCVIPKTPKRRQIRNGRPATVVISKEIDPMLLPGAAEISEFCRHGVPLLVFDVRARCQKREKECEQEAETPAILPLPTEWSKVSTVGLRNSGVP